MAAYTLKLNDSATFDTYAKSDASVQFPTGAYTFEFWMKKVTGRDWGIKHAFDFSSSFGQNTALQIYADGVRAYWLIHGWYLTINGDVFTPSDSVLKHYCVMSDGSTYVKIFQEGVEIGTHDYAGGNPSTVAYLNLGCLYNGTTQAPVIFDEVRLSDVVRYNSAGFTPPTTPFDSDGNTLLLWHLDDGSGTAINDSSANNRDGTITGTNYAWVEGGLVGNVVPNAPTNSTPANAATEQAVNPTLTGSTYSDPDSDAHYSSQWQIAFNNDFTNNLVWDSGTELVNLESIVVNTTNGTFSGGLNGLTALQKGIPYYWRVRYNDNVSGWSAYSTPTYFVVLNPVGKGMVFNPLTGKFDKIKEYPFITSASLYQMPTSTDTNAPNNSFYWSLTQNALVYKDGDGNVKTVDLTAV